MDKEMIIKVLYFLTEQGRGDDTIWETIDRLEKENQ